MPDFKNGNLLKQKEKADWNRNALVEDSRESGLGSAQGIRHGAVCIIGLACVLVPPTPLPSDVLIGHGFQEETCCAFSEGLVLLFFFKYTS